MPITVTKSDSYIDYVVTISDDSGVDLGTATSLIEAVDSSGRRYGMSFISATPNSNAKLIDLTYRIFLFGFSQSSNGTLTVRAKAGAKDIFSNISESSALDSITVAIPTRPSIQAATFNNIDSDLSVYNFSLTYTDNTAVDTSSIDDARVIVSGPSGFSKLCTLVNKSPSSGNSASIVCNYSLDGPFNESTEGIYTVSINADEFFDEFGTGNNAITAGTFEVSIPGGGTSFDHNFKSLTAIPNNWSLYNATASFSTTTGLTLTKTGPGDWGTNVLHSEPFVYEKGSIVIIDFNTDASPSGVGIAKLKSDGGWGDFGGTDSMMLLSGGELSKGNSAFGPDSSLDSALIVGRLYRVKFEAITATTTEVSYFQDATNSGTYTFIKSAVVPTPPPILSAPTHVMIDIGYPNTIKCQRVQLY